MSDNNETIAKPKNKGGRPKAAKKGKILWVAAEYVDAMNAFLETLKQQHEKQNQQAKQ